MKQIRKVIDDDGNTTRVDYDKLGHGTHINNLDTGLIKTVYNKACNVIQKISANLGSIYDDSLQEKAIENKK